VTTRPRSCQKIHHHDYACARRLKAPDGMCNTTGAHTSPRAQTPSRPTLSSPSGTTSAPPEPGLGYVLPRESRRRPLRQLWRTSGKGSVMTSSTTSASPEPGLGYPLPRESRRRPLHRLWHMSGKDSVMKSGNIFASPEPGLSCLLPRESRRRPLRRL
jgi:hypothetical protein